MRGDLLVKLPSMRRHEHQSSLAVEEVQRTFNSLTDEQKIIEIADIYGKRVGARIPPFGEVLKYHFRTKRSMQAYEERIGQPAIWPTESGIDQEKDPLRFRFSAALYRLETQWLLEHGVNPSFIQQEIMHEDDQTTR